MNPYVEKYIERYIDAVGRHLSGKEKEDILQELKANIYDMLSDDPDIEEVTAVLEGLGEPRLLAQSYPGGQRYLISPFFYDTYIKVMKMVLPIVGCAVAGVGILTELINWSNQDTTNVARIMGSTLGTGLEWGISAVLQVFFWVTMGFVIAERFKERPEIKQEIDKAMGHKDKWTIEDLPKETVPKQYSIKFSETIVELVLSVVFSLIFIFALLDYIPLFMTRIDGSTTIWQIFTPEFVRVAIPITLLFLFLQLAEDVMKLIFRRWTLAVGITAALHNVITLVVSLIVLTNIPVVSQDIFDSWVLHVPFQSGVDANFIIGVIITIICMSGLISATAKTIKYQLENIS